MMQFQSITRPLFSVLCSIGLMTLATVLAAEPVPPVATAAKSGPVESGEAEANTDSDASPPQESGVPERLRHKNRAMTASVPTTVSTGKQAQGSSHAMQHQETDMNFVRESAATKTAAQHTPEWTDPTGSDPGRSEPVEEGGTEDINIGVGENQAAEGEAKVD